MPCDVLMDMRPAIVAPSHLLREPLASPTIGLASAQAIDSPAPGQSNDPAQWPSLRGFITGGAIPYFSKDILEEVFDVGFIVKDVRTDSSHERHITCMQQPQPITEPGLNHLHEAFVGKRQGLALVRHCQDSFV